MPLYEYVCKDCHRKFDKILTVHEHDIAKIQCPKCASARVEKVIEPVVVITSSKTRNW